jgi:hypothetical protein
MAGQMFVAGNAYLDNADAKEPDAMIQSQILQAKRNLRRNRCVPAYRANGVESSRARRREVPNREHKRVEVPLPIQRNANR